MITDTYYGSSLESFLSNRKTTKDWSMTGMASNMKGKWAISDEDYPEFLGLMHEYLFEKRLRPNGFVEQRRSDGITPLLIDLDFRYLTTQSISRAFDTSHIQGFIHETAAVIKEFFDLKMIPSLRFFVTLRPQPYLDPKSVNKEIKDGVHIICPDFRVCPSLHGVIRQILVNREAITTTFKDTGYTNKEDEKVFDKSLVATNGWFFYGESKPTIPAYALTHVFKYTTSSGKMIQETLTKYDTKTLLKLLSIRNTTQPLLTIQESQKEIIDGVIEKMNTKPVHVTTEQKNVLISQEQVVGMLPIIMDSYNTIVCSEDEIAIAKRLILECLSAKRAEEYDSWIKVGWCLRNIDASDEMFETWMKFSSKSPKSAGNNVEQLRRDWLHGSMRRVTGSPSLKFGSLRMWAKEDNSVLYTQIMDGDIISFIVKTAITFQGGTHHHVAKMIHKLFYDIYKCTVDGRNSEWYEFKDHIWNPMPQGLLIKTTITDTIGHKADSARYSLKPPENNDPDFDNKLKSYNENMKKMLKLQENLYNANFKDSVVKEAVQLFYDRDFYKKINQNPYLLGCANGILNLRESVFDDAGNPIRYKPALHPGTAQDCVTLKVGVTPDGKEAIDYVPYDPKDPKQTEIMDFFKKLFPAEDLREYVLTLTAGCLEGANKEQCFYIMTGSGGNGKSKFVDLVNGVLGQYGGSLSSTALTRKRPESGAANPDIMSIKGCRFVEIKEPDDGEPINSARMKQFSGEDLVEARGLYKDQEKFKITGKIFLACNRMPPIHSMDGGTWRRIRVIPFDSRFLPVGDPLIDESRHIYPRDDMMDEKLKSWRVPFFSLLVHYYEKKYCPHGIKNVPTIVMQACEAYKGNYDSFGKFIKARVRRLAGWDESPTFKEFFKVYKNWVNDQTTSCKKLSESELRIRLNELYQVPADGKTYQHVRLFDSDEDAEDYDKEVEDAKAVFTSTTTTATTEEDEDS
jgi:P4 family phage/plasmid primase-like protien